MAHENHNTQDVIDLADASNELCTAIETLRVAYPNMDDMVWSYLYKQKDALWKILAKFDY